MFEGTCSGGGGEDTTGLGGETEPVGGGHMVCDQTQTIAERRNWLLSGASGRALV